MVSGPISTKISSKISNIPPTLQSKHILRISELETEIEELKDLIKSFEMITKKNSVSDSAKDLLEKLSVMLLNKNTDPNFFSESQKEIIRSLFGDYATKIYKNKINEQTDKLFKAQRDKVSVEKDLKIMIERCIYYLNLLIKVDSKSLDKSVMNQFPTKDKLIDDKVGLIERMNDLDKMISDEEGFDENHHITSFMSKGSNKFKEMSSELIVDSSKLDFDLGLLKSESSKINIVIDDKEKTKSHTSYDE